jgi:uncharacterized membrane protein
VILNPMLAVLALALALLAAHLYRTARRMPFGTLRTRRTRVAHAVNTVALVLALVMLVVALLSLLD